MVKACTETRQIDFILIEENEDNGIINNNDIRSTKTKKKKDMDKILKHIGAKKNNGKSVRRSK